MKHPRTVAAAAALLLFALCGCQETAGPLMPAATSSVPSPSSAELAAVVQAAVEDRNGTVLDTPPAPPRASRTGR